ncbi:MAG: glycoside hydrolase family 95 protein [Ilumatobacteraceae bacterium]
MTRPPDTPLIWSASPATEWLNGYPAGNGRLGAMVFGRLNKEMIGLNEETLWTRQNPDRNNPDSLAHLDQVRELLLAGKPLEASFVSEYAMFGRPHYQASYQQMATLKLLTLDHHIEWARDYRREIDLDSGLITVEYTLGDDRHTREIFVSAPDDVIVVRLSSTSSQERQIAMNLYRKQDAVGTWLDSSTLELTGRCGSRGTSFDALLRVIPGDGEVEAVGDHLHVRDCGATTIIVAASTDFRHADPSAHVRGTLAAAEAVGFDGIRQRHLVEHSERMGRVRISLGSSSAESASVPTETRLERIRSGGDDPGLLALFFQFGRYLLLGSSRPGTLPANLQGIWNEMYIPAWDSKFTININAQMNYWPAEVGALSECHEPFFDLLDRVRVSGAETARVHYDCGGFVAHHNTDLWADTAPLDNVRCGLWPLGGAWMALHLWDHYDFTRDVDFLASRAYPVLCDATRFLIDFAVERDGELLIGPTMSPENAYVVDGVPTALCMNPAMDVQITRALFDRCLAAAAVLGLDDPLLSEIAVSRSKLPPPKIDSNGRLMEWNEEVVEWEPGHRHLSHLFGVYPDDQLIADEDPALIAAVTASLERRLEHSTPNGSWSRSWAALVWARLGNGDGAVASLQGMLAACTSVSLMTTHPPGGTNPNITFQIDGNLGTPAAIAEMILQSHGDTVRLLPALPASWDSGVVTGLRARGGFIVDVRWNEHRVLAATIIATVDGPLQVVAPGATRCLGPDGASVDGVSAVGAEARFALTARAGDRFEFVGAASITETLPQETRA